MNKQHMGAVQEYAERSCVTQRVMGQVYMVFWWLLHETEDTADADHTWRT